MAEEISVQEGTELVDETVKHTIVVSPILDAVQAEMENFPRVDCPLEHVFTPGLYSRKITVPAGTRLVTHTHLTRHQFVMTKGRGRMWTPEAGWAEIQAPIIGVTEVGTRRAFEAYDEIEWVTFHATNETDVKVLEETLVLQRDPLPKEIPV